MKHLDRIKVGISSCLLGEEVRYNGGHKLSRLCTHELNRYFDYVSICPEVGIGMGIPRTPIRLVGDPDNPRVVQVDDPERDFTAPLKAFAHEKVAQMDEFCGYIFMKNSPSCGAFRVKVYRDNGYPDQESGMGVFARAVQDAWPLLPIEESGRLQDPVLKENFVTRVFAYHHWQQLQAGGLSAAGLVDFHSRYKYTLMAHDPAGYTHLGQMIAGVGRQDPDELGPRYFEGLMKALEKKATRRSHTNVLMHLQGYLKKQLTAREKEKLGESIEQYRTGILPLIVPVTLLKHHFHSHPNDYIARQAYLEPYPDDLRLRNLI